MYLLFRYLIVFSAFFSLTACHHHNLVSRVDESHYVINKDDVDSSIYKNIQPYKQKMDAEMSAVIVQSEGALTKGDLESTLGNFVADAVMFETKKIVGSDSSILNVVILNKGGLRNSLPKGNITVGNIFELMPFENELILLKMSREKFQDMINKIAEKGGLPQVGITMKINQGKPVDVLINGKAFDVAKNYVVITSDYLANGGDSYTFFSDPIERKLLNKKLRDAIIDYCKDLSKAGKTLKPYVDGRIQLSK